MKIRLKPVGFERTNTDYFHYAFAILCLLAAIPAGIVLITIPLILCCIGFAIFEYRLPNPPRQFPLLLSPILAPALVILFSPSLSQAANLYQFFNVTPQGPLALGIAGCAWLLIMPLLLVDNQWRGVILAAFWMPITFGLGVIGTLDITGWL